MKQCVTCSTVKSLNRFPSNRRRRDGRASNCKLCEKAYHARWNKRHRKENLRKAAVHRKRRPHYDRDYGRTQNGRAIKLFHAIGYRVRHNPYYKKLGINFNREQFLSWTQASSTYTRCFNKWARSGYQRELTPSIDRLNSSLGYNLRNIQMVPLQYNLTKKKRRSSAVRSRKKS